jgi:hypothetical protein
MLGWLGRLIRWFRRRKGPGVPAPPVARSATLIEGMEDRRMM